MLTLLFAPRSLALLVLALLLARPSALVVVPVLVPVSGPQASTDMAGEMKWVEREIADRAAACYRPHAPDRAHIVYSVVVDAGVLRVVNAHETGVYTEESQCVMHAANEVTRRVDGIPDQRRAAELGVVLRDSWVRNEVRLSRPALDTLQAFGDYQPPAPTTPPTMWDVCLVGGNSVAPWYGVVARIVVVDGHGRVDHVDVVDPYDSDDCEGTRVRAMAEHLQGVELPGAKLPDGVLYVRLAVARGASHDNRATRVESHAYRARPTVDIPLWNMPRGYDDGWYDIE